MSPSSKNHATVEIKPDKTPPNETGLISKNLATSGIHLMIEITA
jgi:hypothetical protein